MAIGSDYSITALSGAGLVVQYSTDKETWHSGIGDDDIWMRLKYGSDTEWSVFRISGENGRGIVSQQTFWLAERTGEAPGNSVYADSDGKVYTDENGAVYIDGSWTEDPQTATEENPYLWMFMLTVYNDGTVYCTQPVLAATWVKGDDGKQGEDGVPGEPGVPYVARQNYGSYASYKLGSVYVHGYFIQDRQWVQADVPGYFTMAGETYWVWGAAESASAVDGYLCVQKASVNKPNVKTEICAPAVCFNTFADKTKWRMLPRKDGAAVDVDGPSDYIAFARIKISRAGGSVYVESIDPSLLSDISSSDEGAFTLSYEGIVTGVGTADDGTAVTGAAFTDYETAAIMPYGVECVDDDTNTYTLKSVLGGSLTKYAQRGGVVFHMQPEYVQMKLADGSAKYVLAPASAGTGLVYVYNGTVWENVTAGSEGWGTIVSLMGKDLLGIAGLYAMRGFSVPSVCGTYIKTLTSNKAFIEELVANKAFIENLAAKVITLQSGGVIKSGNYNGDITQMNGTAGFAMDYNGNADFVNMHATNMTAVGGTFTDITTDNMTANNMEATNGTFNNVIISKTSVFNGFIGNGYIYEKLIAGFSFFDPDIGDGSYSNNLTMVLGKSSSNVKKVVKCGVGKYVVVLSDIGDFLKVGLENALLSQYDITSYAFSIETIYASDKKGRQSHASNKYEYVTRDPKYNVCVRAALATGTSDGSKFDIITPVYESDLYKDTTTVREAMPWSMNVYPYEIKIDGNYCYGLGFTVTDFNTDEFENLRGGGKFIIKATVIST